MNQQEVYSIFKTAVKGFLHHNSTLHAAALTFFIMLPLPTLLLTVTAFFGYFIGEARAVQILTEQISSVVGPTVARLFSEVIINAGSPFSSIWTTIIVVGFSIGGAVGAFSVLRDTMDVIWGAKLPKSLPILKRIHDKILPFILVSICGLIVMLWTGVTSSFFDLLSFLAINETLTFILFQLAQVWLSFLSVTVLLAICYKLIPRVKVCWREVVLASFVTGIVFTAINYLFGVYIQTFTVTTVAGAAGSLLIILLWIFVLNQIVLFGAEISKAHATTMRTL